MQEMKNKAANSMRTIGSLTLCRSPPEGRLADRFRVVVFPLSPGAAARSGSTTAIPMLAWTLISSRTFDGRIQLLDYFPPLFGTPQRLRRHCRPELLRLPVRNALLLSALEEIIEKQSASTSWRAGLRKVEPLRSGRSQARVAQNSRRTVAARAGSWKLEY